MNTAKNEVFIGLLFSGWMILWSSGIKLWGSGSTGGGIFLSGGTGERVMSILSTSGGTPPRRETEKTT